MFCLLGNASTNWNRKETMKLSRKPFWSMVFDWWVCESLLCLPVCFENRRGKTTTVLFKADLKWHHSANQNPQSQSSKSPSQQILFTLRLVHKLRINILYTPLKKFQQPPRFCYCNLTNHRWPSCIYWTQIGMKVLADHGTISTIFSSKFQPLRMLHSCNGKCIEKSMTFQKKTVDGLRILWGSGTVAWGPKDLLTLTLRNGN